MPRLYRVCEEDLAELEKTIPLLSEAMLTIQTPLTRTKLRLCKSILSDIRWDYGPHGKAEQVPVDNEDQDFAS